MLHVIDTYWPNYEGPKVSDVAVSWSTAYKAYGFARKADGSKFFASGYLEELANSDISGPKAPSSIPPNWMPVNETEVEDRFDLKPAYSRCANWSKEQIFGAVGNLEADESIMEKTSVFQTKQEVIKEDSDDEESDPVILGLRDKLLADKAKLDAFEEDGGNVHSQLNPLLKSLTSALEDGHNPEILEEVKGYLNDAIARAQMPEDNNSVRPSGHFVGALSQESGSRLTNRKRRLKSESI